MFAVIISFCLSIFSRNEQIFNNREIIDNWNDPSYIIHRLTNQKKRKILAWKNNTAYKPPSNQTIKNVSFYIFLYFKHTHTHTCTHKNRNKDILYKLFSNCSRLFHPLRFFSPPFLDGNIHHGWNEFNWEGKRGGKKEREGKREGWKAEEKIKPRNFNDTASTQCSPAWKFPCFDK